MKKAKFDTREVQRDFFIKIKKKLGIGSRNLSKILGLKSRGGLESYTAMRTAPPLWIVKKLEKLTNIKGNYKMIDGRVCRKKRGFMPANPEFAEKALKEKFSGDYDYLLTLIKSDLSIAKITKKMRGQGYSFDGSKINVYIGAYRKKLLSRIVSEIKPNKNEIILRGFIERSKGTLQILFNLFCLYKILEEKKIRVGLEISEDRKKIRIFPLNFGRNLIKSRKTIKILITEKSGLKIKDNVDIILDPNKFGFSIINTIYDLDAKRLAEEALKEKIIIDAYRSTPFNHKGDLSLYINNKNFLIEITRASSYKSGYFKIGQCFVQKNSWPDSNQILICKKKLLSKDSINALDKIGIKIIYSDFNKNWGKESLSKIFDYIKNG